ncbi:Hydroquinone glucosyltransferase, partial [Mucuna pruriens]
MLSSIAILKRKYIWISYLGTLGPHKLRVRNISIPKYVLDLFLEMSMLDCKPVDILIVQNHHLGEYPDQKPTNKERYQRLDTGSYIDADWAGSVIDRRSTWGYFTFVGGNLVTWRRKKQKVVALLSVEVKFRDITKGLSFFVQHDFTEHVEVDRHFIKQKLEDNIIVESMRFSFYNKNKNNSGVYLIGPIMQTGASDEQKDSECVRWLENQRPNSVLYVSFGNAAYLGAASGDPLRFLPDGFLERTKGRGFVVPSWAPQTQILSHPSTGGFLTHCGWNSILESIVLGVPMLTWPLFAEQRMNAVLLTDGLKVALRPKFNENGIAEREEIAMVVKALMVGEEGNEIRQRIEKLKDAAADALKEDGSSTRALYQFGSQLESCGTPLVKFQKIIVTNKTEV